MKKLLNNIFWAIYRLTPQGKTAYAFKQAVKGAQETHLEKTITKLSVVQTAKKKLKQKKILAFSKGSSITKPKTTNHQLISATKKETAEQLSAARLTITKNGKFKNA